MGYAEVSQYITDGKLEKLVEHVISVALGAQQKASVEFYKNVIDPFSAMFEMGGFNRSAEAWQSSELDRKAQKTLQNHVGEFHQKILGSVNSWEDLGTGENVDLLNSSKKIIAEVKNKHNTVSGGKLKDIYDDLSKLITPKASKYYKYTAYFVNIIPTKKNIGADLPFTPSDRAAGKKCAANDKIRIIDGSSFYALVTGRPNALQELYKALPKVIENILKNKSKEYKYSDADLDTLKVYFKKAFLKNSEFEITPVDLASLDDIL